MLAHGGGTNRGGQIKTDSLGFWVSGRPRAVGKPFKKVGAKHPTFLKGFLAARGRPDTHNPRLAVFTCPPHVSATPMSRHMNKAAN
jgi:hypothetical protein